MQPLSKILKWWAIALLIIPLALLIFSPLYVYKKIIRLIARKRRPTLKGFLTGYDSIFAVDEFYSKTYATNITLCVLDGNITAEELQTGFTETVLSAKTNNKQKYERLNERPVQFGGYYFWEKVKNLDIKTHIRKIHDFRLQEDFEDISLHENQLHNMLGQIMTSPLPKDGALWEILLLNGYKSDGCVVVFRLHHTLADGYSFNHLIDQMIRKQSLYLVKDQQPKSISQKAKLVLTTPLMLGTLYVDGFREKDMYTQRKMNSTGLVSMTTIPLATMKCIRRASKTHFATIGMSLMTGALRRYHHYTAGKSDGLKQLLLPETVSIMHSLPKPNHPLSGLCNHWNVGLFKIPMRSISNSFERLLKAEQNFETYMEEQYDYLIHVFMPLFRLVPHIVIKLFFSTNFGTGMGFTSIPAYQHEAQLFGYPIRNLYKVFGLQWRQSAVASAVYTHNGTVGYTMYANKDIIPDQRGMDLLTKVFLHQELDELHSTAQTLLSMNQSKSVSQPDILSTLTNRQRTEGFA